MHTFRAGGGREHGIEQLAQPSAAQRSGLMVADDLAEEGPDFTMVSPYDAIETKIERLGFVELEEFAHQLDEAGFHLLSLRQQRGYSGTCVRHGHSCGDSRVPPAIVRSRLAEGVARIVAENLGQVNHHVDRIGTTPRLRQAREGLATSPDSPVERQPIRFNSSLCCRGTRAPSRRITRCPRLKPRIADVHFRRKNGLQCANDSDLLQAAGKSMQRQRMAAHRVFTPLGVRR